MGFLAFIEACEIGRLLIEDALNAGFQISIRHLSNGAEAGGHQSRRRGDTRNLDDLCRRLRRCVGGAVIHVSVVDENSFKMLKGWAFYFVPYSDDVIWLAEDRWPVRDRDEAEALLLRAMRRVRELKPLPDNVVSLKRGNEKSPGANRG
jgi:hypothetical protein